MPKRPIPILMYHSIEEMPKSTVMRSLHVSPKRFEVQMWLLNMLGYKGLSMRDLVPYLEGEKKEFSEVLIPCELVIRESSGPCPQERVQAVS